MPDTNLKENRKGGESLHLVARLTSFHHLLELLLISHNLFDGKLPMELPKNDKVPSCFFITSWVGGTPLLHTLIDSVACVDLISPATVQRLHLQAHATGEPLWSLRVASNKLVPITECVDILVNVAGVKMMVTAYLTGIGVTYDLLLLRRWMEPIGTEKNFQHQYFIINEPNGEKLVVPPTKEDMFKDSGWTQEELDEQMTEEEIE
ncbi:MAG: hypothetical protein M1840_004637 [Geoglossum simile]|nr:MAG: hypothetical protein M1840_004637 [Geoglossum simile]